MSRKRKGKEEESDEYRITGDKSRKWDMERKSEKDKKSYMRGRMQGKRGRHVMKKG